MKHYVLSLALILCSALPARSGLLPATEFSLPNLSALPGETGTFQVQGQVNQVLMAASYSVAVELDPFSISDIAFTSESPLALFDMLNFATGSFPTAGIAYGRINNDNPMTGDPREDEVAVGQYNMGTIGYSVSPSATVGTVVQLKIPDDSTHFRDDQDLEFSATTINGSITVVPEPSSVTMLIGLWLLGLSCRHCGNER